MGKFCIATVDGAGCPVIEIDKDEEMRVLAKAGQRKPKGKHPKE